MRACVRACVRVCVRAYVLSGLLDAEMLSTQTACEEAMTVLEEVIMFTFQQSIYYLTKVSQSEPAHTPSRKLKRHVAFRLILVQTENTKPGGNGRAYSGRAS